MSRAGTRQRKIGPSDLEFEGYMRAPDEAKPTAIGLWLHTDVEGRREFVPELIAAAIYPGQAATERVVEHLLMLDESGFLTIYQAEDREWIELLRPLRSDVRNAPPSECPPCRDISRHVVAVGGERAGARGSGDGSDRVGARERARERMRSEQAERESEWARWRRDQERAAEPPRRPLLLDAPPIGCPDHPNGRFADCGPCGTARRQHDRWVAQQRYEEELVIDDEEPF